MCLSDVVVASWTATAKVGSLILDQDNLHICYYLIISDHECFADWYYS